MSAFLATLDQALVLLAEAKTIQQTHQIVSMAAAAEQYAKEHNLSVEAYNYAAEIKLRSYRHLGEILKQTPKNGGTRGQLQGDIPVGSSILVPPTDTTPTLADSGLTKKQSSQAQTIANISPEDFEQLLESKKDEGDKLTVSSLIKTVKRKQRKQERDDRRAPAEAPLDTDTYQLLCADIADQPTLPTRINAIITDPPYPREYLPVYGELAKWAADWLKPGGSLLVMAGQSYLPEILALMTPHIRYHWTLAYLTPGGQSAQLWKRKVNTFWKPVLWFVNGDYDGPWIGDVAKSATNDNDKRFHSWGQSESGMADLIERVTKPGDTIADPFCGGGATGAVALQLGRQFIGIDQDTAAIASTRTRLASLEYA